MAFDSRIGCLSHEEGASLRCDRKAVAEARSDIETRLLGSSPPPLSSISSYLAFAGEEGSRYMGAGFTWISLWTP